MLPGEVATLARKDVVTLRCMLYGFDSKVVINQGDSGGPLYKFDQTKAILGFKSQKFVSR